MPTNGQNAIAILKRREHVWTLYCQGTTQAIIMADLGLSKKVVSGDIQAFQKLWKSTATKRIELLIAEQLAKIDLAEREAWNAWHASQKDVVSTKAATSGKTKRAEKTTRSQIGNPRYLQAVLECVKQRTVLLGLSAPPRVAPDIFETMSEQELNEYAQRMGIATPPWRETLFLTATPASAESQPLVRETQASGGCQPPDSPEHSPRVVECGETHSD